MDSPRALPAMMTRWSPGGTIPSAARSRTAARSWRRRRFRTTAEPTRRGTANATAGRPGRGTDTTVSGPRRTLRPSSRNRRKTSRDEIRSTPAVTPRSARSGGEPMPALATPGLDDGSSGPVGHPVPEAVLAGAASGLWLVGALHENSWCSGRSSRPVRPCRSTVLRVDHREQTPSGTGRHGRARRRRGGRSGAPGDCSGRTRTTRG